MTSGIERVPVRPFNPILLAWVALSLCACPDPWRQGDGFYDPTVIPRIELTFAADQWQAFQDARQAKLKTWVYCDVATGASTFQGAACRSKGNPDKWVEEKKPEFMVRFDKWDDNGRLLGLREINLERNPEHAAPIRDFVAMDMMRAAGILAPRVNHATVTVNGQDYGLYQNIEVVDKEFLQTWTPDAEGNLYDQGTTLATNQSVGDTSDLDALRTLVDTEPSDADHAAFYTKLAALVDVHQVLREIAAEVVLPSWDNFSNGSHNFYYYHPPVGRFIVIPWDLDDCLSPVLTTVDVDPWSFLGHSVEPNRMRVLMMTNPAWHDEYLADLVEIRDGAFQAVPGVADAAAARIRSLVLADPYVTGGADAFDNDLADLKHRVEARTAFLKAYLGR